MVYGRNAVLEAIRAGRTVRRVMLDEGASSSDPRIAELHRLCREAGIPIERAPRRELDRIAQGHQHQGVIAIAEPRTSPRLSELLKSCRREGRDPCVLLLRDVAHAQNLGAIVRTAAAAGVDAVVIPTGQGAAVTPEVVRISQGAAEYVPVIQQSLTQAAASLRREGVRLIGADASAEQPYWDCDLTGPLAIVMGGEHAGLKGPLANRCDAMVRIPMRGRVESLNVSVACALLLYERLRQTLQRSA